MVSTHSWSSSISCKTPPFTDGLDGERFNRHYAEAQRDKRLHAKQRLYNLWHFYLAPVAMGMGIGAVVADRFFAAQADLLYWVLVAYGIALIITPTVLAYRRKKHSHRRHQQFYTAAIERCIQEEQGRA